MIPITPEPFDALQGRYAAAVAEAYDTSDADIMADHRRPGNQPQHVFDFEDGLRLIISRERFSDGAEGIHISASFTLGTEVMREIVSSLSPKRRLMDVAIGRWRKLSGNTADVDFQGWTERGIPHWLVLSRREVTH